jgi:MraZ protein
VVVPNEHALEVHPLAEWQRIEAKVNAQPMFTPEVRQLSRLYMSRAKDITLDNVGRRAAAARHAQGCRPRQGGHAGGGGRPMFEVWDRTRFEEYERTHGDSLPTLFEKLSGYGV